jgi:hypothetical protein
VFLHSGVSARTLDGLDQESSVWYWNAWLGVEDLSSKKSGLIKWDVRYLPHCLQYLRMLTTPNTEENVLALYVGWWQKQASAHTQHPTDRPLINLLLVLTTARTFFPFWTVILNLQGPAQ